MHLTTNSSAVHIIRATTQDIFKFSSSDDSFWIVSIRQQALYDSNMKLVLCSILFIIRDDLNCNERRPPHPLTGDTVWWHSDTKTERLMVDGGGGGDCWAPVEQGNCPSEIMSVQFQPNKVT